MNICRSSSYFSLCSRSTKPGTATRQPSKISAICLQETWLTDNDDLCLFSLPGYECISQGKHCSGKGGLVIYVDYTYTSKVKLNINMHESWEGLIVHITGGGLTKTVT